jgi:hypothetical protein
MKKTKKFFALLAIISGLAFSAGQASPFFSQTTKAEQAKEEALKVSEQAKTEAQTKSEQEAYLKKWMVEQAEQEKKYGEVLKTYSLKYISVMEFMSAAKFYVLDYSGSENALTVRIRKMNIPAFEDLLKKLDVEKRNIQFQVYTIIASKELPSGLPYENLLKNETKEIENRDLKRVLDEMKGLWNFKHYWADSPSYLTMKDGSGSNSVRLVSNRGAFFMNALQVRVRGDEPGKRTISVGRIQLSEPIPDGKSTLIDTSDITFKEKGYLVVGVSGFSSGWSGAALILIINAEIK